MSAQFVAPFAAPSTRPGVALSSSFKRNCGKSNQPRPAPHVRTVSAELSELTPLLVVGAGGALAAFVFFSRRALPSDSGAAKAEQQRVRISPLSPEMLALIPEPGDDGLNDGDEGLATMAFWDWTNIRVYGSGDMRQGRIGRHLADLAQRNFDTNVVLLCCWCGATGREIGLFEMKEAAAWAQDVADWKARVQRMALFGERPEDQQAYDGKEVEQQAWRPQVPSMPQPPGSIREIIEAPAARLRTGREAALAARDYLQSYVSDAIEAPVGKKEAALFRQVIRAVFPQGADGAGGFPTVEVTKEGEDEEESVARDFADVRVDFRLEHPDLDRNALAGDFERIVKRIDEDETL